MKKIVISVLTVFMLLISPTYADVTDTIQNGAYVLVRGNIEKEKEGVFVTLVVTKQGVTDEDIISSFDSSVSYIDQTQTDENGDYAFYVYLPDSFDADSIYIKSGEGKYRIVKKENVSYTAAPLVCGAIENINSAYYAYNDDTQRVQAMLAAISSEHLMLDKLAENEEYSKLKNPSAVAEYLLNSVKNEKLVYDSDEELADAVERVVSEWKKAVGISAVNESENQTEMKRIFNKYADVFGINTERLNSVTSGEFFCEQVKRIAPSTIEELKQAYNSSCAFSDVNNTISWSVLKNIFETDYEYLGVEMNPSGAYSKIKDKDSFFKELSESIPFADLNKLVSDFNALVSRFNIVNRPASPSSGGGGGSSTGRGLSGAIAAPNTEAVTNTTAAKKTFKDIEQVNWARESIEYLLENNIVNGVNDECFEPQRNVTRAEFLKMIVLAFNIQSEKSGEAFNDTKSEDWYYEYAVTGKNTGIVTGDENGNFNSDINISRQDMAVMLYRCMKKNSSENISLYFEDNEDVNDYALEAISVLSGMGIINGYEDNTFRPDSNATRAEAAKMIYCAIKEN